MASTGEILDRRGVLKGLAALAYLAGPVGALARDYSGPAEVFEEIDRLEGDVMARLLAIARVLPATLPFVRAVEAVHARHRQDRTRLRERLRLPPLAGGRPGAVDRDLKALRDVQQDLVHAHAEGLPALGDQAAVEVLAGHLVTLASQLTVIDLWIEDEDARGEAKAGARTPLRRFPSGGSPLSPSRDSLAARRSNEAKAGARTPLR